LSFKAKNGKNRNPERSARERGTLRLGQSLALACVASVAPAAAAPTLGGYSCAADRAVGLQGDAASGQRYGGRIQLPPAERHFTISLRRTEVGRGKRCRAGQADAPESPLGDAYSLWWFCTAGTELSFSPGKYEPTLRGDDLNIFRDRLSGWFHLADDLRYLFAYTDFAGNFFLEEGTCERE
jgi:hypothetical protein